MTIFPVFSPTNVPDATISFGSATQFSPDATSFTLSSADLGTAASNRTIIVACGGLDTVNNDITSVTVDGTAMSETHRGNDSTFRAFIFEVDLATGTSGDVVVSFDGTVTRFGIAVWAAYGIGAADDKPSSIGYPTEAGDVDISAGGVAIGYSLNHNPTATVSWTNMTERFDDTIDYTSHTGADTTSATAATVTVTCDWPTRDSGPFLLCAWPKG